jgi:HK97 family phage prohead protease
MSKKKDKGERYETRHYPVEVLSLERRDEGPAVISGHAAVFDVLSPPMWGFREKIQAGAFAKSLEQDDVRALWNHNSDTPLGRMSNGTLKLSEDERGLAFALELPDTQAGRDVAALVERGDVDGMSFGFRVLDDKVEPGTDDELDTRILLEVQLREISPVVWPAYPQTDVGVARAFEGTGLEADAVLPAIGRAARGEELRAGDLEALGGLLEKLELPEAEGEVTEEAAAMAAREISAGAMGCERMERARRRQKLAELE